MQLVSQHCCKKSWTAMFCVFTPANQTCLAANQVAAGCEKLLQKAERSSTFCSKVCKCCAFYWPQGKLATRNITPIYGVTPAFIIHSEVNIHITQIAATRFVLRQVWPWEVKRATSLFNSSCCNIAKQVARFVACFTIALIRVCICFIYVVLENTPWRYTRLKVVGERQYFAYFLLRKENVHSKYFYLQDGVTGFWPNLALTYWNAVISN